MAGHVGTFTSAFTTLISKFIIYFELKYQWGKYSVCEDLMSLSPKVRSKFGVVSSSFLLRMTIETLLKYVSWFTSLKPFACDLTPKACAGP